MRYNITLNQSISMKKDRISIFILAVEIVAIIAMHATKQNTNQITVSPAGQIKPTPVFSTTMSPVNTVLFRPEHSR